MYNKAFFFRAVNEEDKALALGSMTVLLSLFSFIPGPIIMGAIVGKIGEYINDSYEQWEML